MRLALALAAVCATVIALLLFFTGERPGLDGAAPPSNAVRPTSELIDQPVEAVLVSERSTPARLALESTRAELVRLQVHVLTSSSRTPASNHRIAAFRSGAPLEWSERAVRNGEALPGEIASTDAKGDAILFVEPGHTHVIVSVDDLAPRSRVEVGALAAGESCSVELAVRAPPDLVVHGRALEVGTGAPVPGTSVRFTENGPEVARTDENGAFVIAGRSRERKQFVVTRADWLATYAPLEAGHERADTRLVVLMARRTHVDVRVVDRAGVEVEAVVRANFDREQLTHGAPFLSDDVWFGVARPDAQVRLGNIPAQVALTVSAVASLGAQASETVVLPATSHATVLTLVLEDGDTILGAVSGFRRRGGVEVHLSRPRAFARPGERVFRRTEPLDVTVLTDDNGGFRFAGLGAGPARVSCTDPESAFVAPAIELQLAGDGRTHEVALVATPAARIRGVLLGPDGAPHAGRVSARRSGEVEAVLTAADEQGNFAFDPLLPGEYEVFVSGGARSAHARLDALAGDNFVELHGAPHWTLTLQLVDASGSVVRGSDTLSSEALFGVPGSNMRFNSDDRGLVTVLCISNGKPVNVSARSTDGKLVGQREFAPLEPNDKFVFPERFVLTPAPPNESNDAAGRGK